MTINTQKNGDVLNVAIAGRLDTTTAPELEAALSPELSEPCNVTIDFTGLEYISSAGLRVLLATKKKIGDNDLVIKNANDEIKEVFDITGFTDILTVE